MRAGQARLVLLLAGVAAAVATPAHRPALAQVVVNPGALELLPAQPRPPAARPAAPRQPRSAPRAAPHAAPGQAKPPATPSASATSTAPTPATAAVPAPTPPVKPTLPVVPPAIAALPPPAPVPAPRPQAPPLVPFAADAPGIASPLPGGVRVTFGADRQDLNAATRTALRDLARTLKANDQATVNVYAYAAGTPDDLSTARRLSLGRALAARAVLIGEGVASTRIYPRAMGSTGGDMGPDRVDAVVGAPGPPPPEPAPVALPPAPRAVPAK